MKSVAPSNIDSMVVTEEVFQLLMFWLNTALNMNMLFILVTEEVSQLPIGWLNDVAP